MALGLNTVPSQRSALCSALESAYLTIFALEREGNGSGREKMKVSSKMRRLLKLWCIARWFWICSCSPLYDCSYFGPLVIQQVHEEQFEKRKMAESRKLLVAEQKPWTAAKRRDRKICRALSRSWLSERGSPRPGGTQLQDPSCGAIPVCLSLTVCWVRIEPHLEGIVGLIKAKM